MIKYFFNPPGFVKHLYDNYLWNSVTSNVLITFDDGPNPSTTEIILKILDDNKIVSLFFCVGNNIKQHGSLVSEIISANHSIGNHTFNHQIITQCDHTKGASEIKATNDLLFQKYNYTARYFRPPHGRFNKAMTEILAQNNLKNVMWSLLTYDYKSDVNIVKFALKNYLEKDSVIVFHDSNKSKKVIEYALNYTIEIIHKKNFSIGKVDQCLS